MNAHVLSAAFRSGRPARRAQTSHGSAEAPPVPVFIAYSDIAAARHAVHSVTKLLANYRTPRRVEPMLWRFAQLDDARWRETSLREAARAQLLVFALGETAGLSAPAEGWIGALTASQRGASLRALAFLGDETWTISLQHAAAATIHAAPAVQNNRAALASSSDREPETVFRACAA